MFRKVGKCQHLGTIVEGKRKKTAQLDAADSYYLDGSAKIDVRGILKRRAADYAISDDPKNYLFEVIRANTSQVFNDNHDGFERSELLRFDPRLKTAVYLTYREKPHHVNHRTENPKRARGILLDAHYNDSSTPLAECPGCGNKTADRKNRDESGLGCKKCGTVVKDDFVEILVAVDRRKDPTFAKGVETGQLRFGSMGCNCAETLCNVCGNVAQSTSDFCTHIRAGNKGTLWASANGRDGWKKITAAEAKREATRRNRKFQAADFVELRADDGYTIRKAAEWCRGVEFDEYSRVHMPADPKASQFEVLNRQASSGDESLDNETRQLLAATKKRKKAAGKEKTAMKFVVVRVDGDPSDTYAAETLEEAMDLAMPDSGSRVEMAEVEAEDAGAARLKAEDTDFTPVNDREAADAPMPKDSDVIINITDDGEGGVDVVDPSGEEEEEDNSIEDLDELEDDDQFTPEEMGVMPASMHTASTYSDWTVSMTKAGTAEVKNAEGMPVAVIPNAKKPVNILASLERRGLTATVKTFGGSLHGKVAQVVEHALDDMKEFADKYTKESVAGEGEDDMQGFADRGNVESDVRNDAESDMEDKRETEVDTAQQDRASDHELGNDSLTPGLRTTDRQESDMREKRKPWNMDQSSLDDGARDHQERLAKKMVGSRVSDGKRVAMVTHFDHESGEFTLAGKDLKAFQVKAQSIESQWKQLDKGPSDEDPMSRKAYEARVQRWAKSQIQAARKQAMSDFTRALRIVAKRQALGLEESPLKEALGVQLANDKTVGYDAVSGRPLEYTAMSNELAVHLIEAAFEDAADKEIDRLAQRAGDLVKESSDYLKSAERDLSKQAHRVPSVTAAEFVDPVEAVSAEQRQAVLNGNMTLNPSPEPSVQDDGPSKLRTALRGTKTARLGARQ